MTTYLTNLGWSNGTSGTWTNGADKVVDNGSGVVNLKYLVNTFSGNDSITGSGGVDTSRAGVISQVSGSPPVYFGVENFGEIIMEKGVNSITGTAIKSSSGYLVYGVYNEEDSRIFMNGNNNSVTGKAEGDGSKFPDNFSIAGIFNRSGIIIMGNGNNNSITGIGTAKVAVSVSEGTAFLSSGIFNRQGGTIALGNGNNNSITGIGGYYNGIFNRGSISIGDGNSASITGTGISDGAYGIYNQFFGGPVNISIGDGNSASITGISKGKKSIGIFNESGCTITMGDGNNDAITGIAKGSAGTGIVNVGDISMGKGSGSITGTGDRYGILNDGIINTGAGNDKVIANGGFGGNGSIFLGDGNDYLKGFGSGNFYGDGGRDTLELTRGTYTVSFGSSGAVNFTDVNSTVMSTSGFEMLIAGRHYSFGSLVNGQTIVV